MNILMGHVILWRYNNSAGERVTGNWGYPITGIDVQDVYVHQYAVQQLGYREKNYRKKSSGSRTRKLGLL